MFGLVIAVVMVCCVLGLGGFRVFDVLDFGLVIVGGVCGCAMRV